MKFDKLFDLLLHLLLDFEFLSCADLGLGVLGCRLWFYHASANIYIRIPLQLSQHCLRLFKAVLTFLPLFIAVKHWLIHRVTILSIGKCGGEIFGIINHLVAL